MLEIFLPGCLWGLSLSWVLLLPWELIRWLKHPSWIPADSVCLPFCWHAFTEDNMEFHWLLWQLEIFLHWLLWDFSFLFALLLLCSLTAFSLPSNSLESYDACVRVKSLQLYPILCNPTDCSLPGSFVHGILQTGILEWIVIPFSRGSSSPRDWTHVISLTPPLAGRFFTTSATWDMSPSKSLHPSSLCPPCQTFFHLCLYSHLNFGPPALHWRLLRNLGTPKTTEKEKGWLEIHWMFSPVEWALETSR